MIILKSKIMPSTPWHLNFFRRRLQIIFTLIMHDYNMVDPAARRIFFPQCELCAPGNDILSLIKALSTVPAAGPRSRRLGKKIAHDFYEILIRRAITCLSLKPDL